MLQQSVAPSLSKSRSGNKRPRMADSNCLSPTKEPQSSPLTETNTLNRARDSRSCQPQQTHKRLEMNHFAGEQAATARHLGNGVSVAFTTQRFNLRLVA